MCSGESVHARNLPPRPAFPAGPGSTDLGVQPLRRPVALDYNWHGSTLIENYSLLDPAVAAFVCIPVLLLVALVAGTSSAWRRSGSTSSQATRAAAVVGVLAVAWTGVSWRLAATGVLQQWDRVPPPFGSGAVGSGRRLPRTARA